MKKDLLDAADQLRNQLGIFYWTLRHGGDVAIAIQKLQLVTYHIEAETAPWCLTVPQTLFARRSQLQLTLLLREARNVLNRVAGDLSTHENARPVVPTTDKRGKEAEEVFLFGPLV